MSKPLTPFPYVGKHCSASAKTVWENLSYFASKVQKPDFSKNERFEVFEIVTL